MSEEKSCGAVIFNNQKILLIKQKNSQFWGFPKGHVEKDETEEETASREIFEEVGLQVRFIRGFKETIHYTLSNNNEKEVVIFCAESNTDLIKTCEIEIAEYQWLTYEEAIEKLTFDDTKEVLRKAYEFYNSIQEIVCVKNE